MGEGNWGSSKEVPNDAVAINIPLPDPMIPLDGETHEIAVLCSPSSSGDNVPFMELFIDGVLVGKAYAAGGSVRGGAWAGGSQGKIGGISGDYAAATVSNIQQWPFGIYMCSYVHMLIHILLSCMLILIHITHTHNLKALAVD